VVNDGFVDSPSDQVIVNAKNVANSIVQTINVNTGWNIFSANVIPANLNMMDIFQSLIDAGKLKKVMDETGKALENFGVFGGWKNNIGNLTIGKGYKVYLTEPVSIILQGTPVSLPLDINLSVGWNIIAYPSDKPQDALTIFQPLIDTGKLKKVMDEAGLALENFGVFGGWMNNIGNLKPNKGYKVNMLSAGTLTIPAGGIKLAVIPPEVLASSHFQKVYIGNGTDHMNINLVELVKGGFKVGDEIGIFDGNLCVGSAQISPDQMISNQISISASCNDEIQMQPDGFISGNLVSIRLFRNNQEYLLQPKLLNGSKIIYAKGESMFALINSELATDSKVITGQISVKCYPNPFSEQITIQIAVSDGPILDVRIIDINGRIIRSLYHGNTKETTILVWNGKNNQGIKVVSGSYYLKANDKVEKIILGH